MRSLGLMIMGIVLLFAATLPADATCHVVRRVQVNYGYHYPTYYPVIQKVYVAAYQPYVPAYSIGYGAHSNGASVTEELLKLKVQILELKLQQSQPQRFGGPQPPNGNGQPPQQPDPPPQGQPVQQGLLSSDASCTKCHSEATANDSGKGFIFAKNGGYDHLSARQTMEILRRVTLPKNDPEFMPKGGNPLTDQQISEMLFRLVTAKKKGP